MYLGSASWFHSACTKVAGSFIGFFYSVGFAYGLQAEFDPVEWLEPDQAVVLEVADASNLMGKVRKLDFWNYELLSQFVEELDSDHCRELLASRGLQLNGKSLEEFQSVFNEFSLGRSYLFLNAKTAGRDWIAAIECPHDEAAKINRCLRELITAFLTPELKQAAEDRFDNADSIHALPFNAGSWFLHEGWIFIHPDESRAKQMRDSLRANSRPKRSLAQNRKWLSSSHLSGVDESDLILYVDPSISRPFLRFLSEEQFRSTGLHELPGAILKVNFGGATPGNETGLKPLITGRLHIRQALPRTGVWELLSGVREIERVPPLAEDIRSAWFAHVDPEGIYKVTRQLVDAIQGDGFFDAAVAQVRRREVDIDLVRELIPGSTGFFGNVAYSKLPELLLRNSEDPSLETRGDFFVMVGVKDREVYKMIVEKLVKRGGRASVDEVTEDSISYWYETEKQSEERLRKLYETMKPNLQDPQIEFEEFKKGWMIYGYALTDQFLFFGLKERSLSFNENQVPLRECHLDVAAANQFYMNQFGRKGQPFLVYYAWKSEFQIWIGTYLWSRERQRRTTSQGFDMSDYQPSVKSLEEVKSLDELAENLAVRIAITLKSQVEFVSGQVYDMETYLMAEGGLFTKDSNKR